jgi:hypothetical protein
MDSSWRRPVAAAQVPRVSGGLCRDWDRDRTFGVNCGKFADTVGDPKRGLTRVSGGQAGVVPFFRKFVEILAIERENAAQTGTMEQTESSDGMIWIFQGKSGKQTDSHSSVLILPVKPFRILPRLFRCSRFLI